ncbi:MAG TPA: VWA domain-containing protein [Kofleriaceae bacterium]|nr:VWA domain-containing protein [Kofleriaceae bacterium]
MSELLARMLAPVELREPWFLLAALAALPIYIWARRPPGRLTFSSLRLLPARPTWRARTSFVPAALLALSAVGLAVALAGPRVPDRRGEVKREGIAIMMVVDVSGSMRALDLSTPDKERTRLDAVVDVFDDFVAGKDGLPGRPNDAIGLISFAGYADTRSPLTLDHDNLVAISRSLEIVRDRDEDGTALGDGLGLAVERLRESRARSRVAILLTDGVSNAGTDAPLDSAKLAKKYGIKVYTIGTGTNGLAPVRIEDPASGRSFLRQTMVEIDEDTLRAIADQTGGAYFRATDAGGLRQVYRQIDQLERSELQGEKWRQYREQFAGPLALGLLLAVLGLVGEATVWRRLP